MWRRLASLATLAVLGLLPAKIEAASAHSVHARSHGATLTLTMPGTVFPRNALVRATVTLRNLSDHTIGIRSACLDAAPSVGVEGETGELVYPPAIPGTTRKCAATYVAKPLTAGRTLVRHPLVVLRGSAVYAVAWLGKPGKRYRGEPIGPSIATGPIRVHLSTGLAPMVVITEGTGVSADVVPAGPSSGPLYYAYAFRCPSTGTHGSGRLTVSDWASSPDGRFDLPAAACSNMELHVIAGWIGQAIGSADYVRSG